MWPRSWLEQPDEAAARVDRAIDAVHAAIGDLRGFITGLRSEIIGRSDLVDLLVALAEPLTRDPTVEVDLDLTTEPVDLPAHARSELLHVAREALSNVIRHAGAARVRIGLAVVDTVVRLEITDDGVGFDPDIPFRAGHYGVTNMRDRVTALGGQLRIERGPTGGTRIIVSVPPVGSHANQRPETEVDARA